MENNKNNGWLNWSEEELKQQRKLYSSHKYIDLWNKGDKLCIQCKKEICFRRSEKFCGGNYCLHLLDYVNDAIQAQFGHYSEDLIGE